MEKNEPVPVEIEGGYPTWWFVCGECHHAINPRVKVCPWCKTELSWDEYGKDSDD